VVRFNGGPLSARLYQWRERGRKGERRASLEAEVAIEQMLTSRLEHVGNGRSGGGGGGVDRIAARGLYPPRSNTYISLSIKFYRTSLGGGILGHKKWGREVRVFCVYRMVVL